MIKDLDYLDRILYFEIQGVALFWWVVLLLIAYFVLSMTIEIIKKVRKQNELH